MPVDVTAAIMVQGGLFITLYDEETLQLYLDRGLYRRSRPSASGSSEIGDFRDDENLRFSNHLTPRRFTPDFEG